MSGLRWLMFGSLAVCIGTLILPLLGPTVSWDEALPVAVPTGGLALSLFVVLARSGDVRAPSLKFLLVTVGTLVFLAGGAVAGLAELPASEAEDSMRSYQEDADRLERELGTAVPGQRAKLSEDLNEQREYADDRKLAAGRFRQAQVAGAFGAIVGLVMLVVGVVLPKKHRADELLIVEEDEDEERQPRRRKRRKRRPSD